MCAANILHPSVFKHTLRTAAKMHLGRFTSSPTLCVFKQAQVKDSESLILSDLCVKYIHEQNIWTA